MASISALMRMAGGRPTATVQEAQATQQPQHTRPARREGKPHKNQRHVPRDRTKASVADAE